MKNTKDTGVNFEKHKTNLGSAAESSVNKIHEGSPTQSKKQEAPTKQPNKEKKS